MTPEQWERVGDYFEQGLTLSGADRERLLAACGDEEVRSEVRSLWTHPPDEGFLAHPLMEEPEARIEVRSGTAASHALQAGGPGRSFGPYRAVRLIGEGGMGLVYLAVQEEPIHRQAAVKVVKHSVRSAEVLQRFEAERQALALMDHPGIARIYDAGADADGLPYFVMEYVEGLPITAYCDRHELGCRERIELFRQVCLAVHHAHQKGILHRDLKPSNVLVSVVDGAACPRIIDFGVAKAIGASAAGSALFTEMGMMVGTPQYMSPEQAEGHSRSLDTTSDVYSLGVLLYELLAGVTPFDTMGPGAEGVATIQRAICEQDVPRPAARFTGMGAAAGEIARLRRTDASALARELRGDLEWILLKALDRDRARRYPSASEFSEDLARHLRHEPVTATPPSVTYELRKFVTRHRRRVAVAAAFLALVLLAAGASFVLYARAVRARAEALRQADRANLAAARAGIQEFRSAEARLILDAIPPSRRGWGWRFLDWLSDTSLATFDCGETGVLTQTAFVENSSRLLMATRSYVHEWDLVGRRPVGRYGPFGELVALSPDGQLVAATARQQGREGIALIWPASGMRTGLLQGHSKPVAHASFSASGHRLATIDRGNELIVWDVSGLRALNRVTLIPTPSPRPDGRTTDVVALSPDGSVVAVSQSSRVLVFEVGSGRRISAVEAHRGPVQALSFDPRGGVLYSASESIRAWDPRNGRLLTSWSQAPARAISALSVHPTLPYVAAAGWTQTVQIWDTRYGDVAGAIATPGIRALQAVAWSPDGRYLVSIDNAGVARLWDGPRFGGTLLRRAPIDPATATFSAYGKLRAPTEYSAMDLSPDGAVLALGSGTAIELVDARDGRLLERMGELHRSQIRELAFAPDGKSLASASAGGRLCVSALPDGADSRAPRLSLRCIDAPYGDIPALAFLEGGRRIAAGFAQGHIQIREVSTLRLEREFRLRARLSTLAANRAGTLLAVAYLMTMPPKSGPRVEFLEVSSGRLLPLADMAREVRFFARTLRFHPRSGHLYVGDSGLEGIGFWDLDTRRKAGALPGPGKQGVGSRDLAFSPDGQILVSTFGDGALAVWDLAAGDSLLHLFRQPMKQVRFAPDGVRLFVNTYDAIEVFDTRARAEARRAIRYSGAGR
jgi:WD40 repeat protein/serine/threonine protein kinase